MTTRNKLGLILPEDPYGPSHRLRLADFWDHHTAPAVPMVFGHQSDVSDWGMLGNDVAGNCGIAGPYHLDMLWNTEGEHPISVSTETALKTYSLLTGWDPSQTDPDTGENPTDTGTDMDQVADYWQETGLPDDSGTPHRILTSLALTPGDLEQAAAAALYLSGIGVGFDLPESAQEQFQAGLPWTVTSAPSEGGHFVDLVGRNAAGNWLGVSWGALVEIDPAFIRKYTIGARVYLAPDFLTNGKSPEGLDLVALEGELGNLPSI